VYISGGGGSIDYPDGSINSELIITQIRNMVLLPPDVTYGTFYGGGEGSILGSSFYITPMAGVSYGITDKLSVALGFRYLLATNKQEAEVKFTEELLPPPIQLPTEFRLESTDKASGFGLTAGVNYRVSENFNLALRYETKASLEFETDSIQDDFGIIEDGELNQRDLPGVLAVGANVKLTDNLSALLDFGWYFQKSADWDEDSRGEEWSALAGDAARFAVGLGYDFGNLLTLNGWWGYTLYQYEDRPAYYNKLGVFETIKANNWTLGLGGKLQLSDRFNINLAVSQSFWKKDDVVEMTFPAALPDPTYDVTINNSITAVAIGLNVRLGD
jgi:long-subunit fatty acid transport protein